MHHFSISKVLFLAASLVPGAGAIAGVPFAAGGTYDESTATGRRPVFELSSSLSGSSAGSESVFVNGVQRTDYAVRIDLSGNGPVLLKTLGVSPLGYGLSAAIGTNRLGSVAGYSRLWVGTSGRGDRAVIWPAGSDAPIQLADLGTDSSGLSLTRAAAVNNLNQATGFAQKYVGGVGKGRRAVRWDGTSAVELPTLGTDAAGNGDATANLINDAGTVWGVAEKFVAGTSVGYRPMRWNSAGAGTELDLPPSLASTSQVAIVKANEQGVAVGYADEPAPVGQTEGRRVLMRWQAAGTGVEELSVPGASPFTVTNLNSSGTAVGFGSAANGQSSFALRWDAGTTSGTVLPSLGSTASGVSSSAAFAINSQGVIGGNSGKPTSNGQSLDFRAVIWIPGLIAPLDLNGVVQGLPLPGEAGGVWKLTNVSDLTDTGIVAGQGLFDPDGNGPTSAYARYYVMLVPRAGTYGRGDATLDGRIDFDDLLRLAQHYGQSNPNRNIHVGDLDLSGSVNFADLLILAQNYGSAAMVEPAQLDGAFASDWALARSLVPEPVIGVLAIGVGVLVRRRRG